jgi:hypothetical protein
MNDLIEALQLLATYMDSKRHSYPTSCEHDVLYVMVDPSVVSPDDIARLEELDFHVDEDLNVFYSFRFGSC